VYYVGRLVGALNFADGTLKWEVDPASESHSPAAAGPNGELYVPLGSGGVGGGVIALDPNDGSEIWTFSTTSQVRTTPLVGLDGSIYFGSDTNELFALNPNGTLKWKFETGGDIHSSPTIADNGTLYFGSRDFKLYALNTTSFGLSASSWPKHQRDVRNTGRFGSDVSRRRFFAPHVFDLSEKSVAVLTMRHVDIPGGSSVLGTTANFRVDVRRRDGSLLFSIDESVEPGETKDIFLRDPNGGALYQGSAVVDAPIKDGLALAPFLTWSLDLGFNAPLQIGAFFSNPAEAAQVHHFPAEASATNGLGIAVQNIGETEVSCTLDFLNADGTAAGQELIELQPLGSLVDFFSDPPPEGFKGSATFTCDAPVVVVAVNQDFSNGNFPTDRLTIKGLN
jgi:hypothetical protein